MRKPNQKDRILRVLKVARNRGVTNRALNRLCFRYASRLFELRRDGFEIKTVCVKPGLYRFVLGSSRLHLSH